MKGPYERLKYDLRRVWECPVCKHHERTAGDVTSLFCKCQAKESPTQRRVMVLIEDGPPRTPRSGPPASTPPASPLAVPDEQSAPQPAPES